MKTLLEYIMFGLGIFCLFYASKNDELTLLGALLLVGSSFFIRRRKNGKGQNVPHGENSN
jgi:LPXTG-motif cell wall-anchored protein